eukprot:SRR837773.10208.p2 GENE.SRR837773.10208~~SRR837773.10208.p2  ORF type:complete len:227 (+),score=95.59 SRR837773.10208:25-681(+)
MKAALEKTFYDDGKFWMSIEDLVANTTGVEYARTFGPNWKKTTHYGRFQQAKLLAVARRGHRGEGARELSFERGDELEVLDFVDSTWWKGKVLSSGQVGFFKDSYVKVKERPVERFDLQGRAAEAAPGGMTVVIMLSQANVMRSRKFYRRDEDGLNYKDLRYGQMQLLVVHPDGSVACRKDGNDRCLWVELTLPGGGAGGSTCCPPTAGPPPSPCGST